MEIGSIIALVVALTTAIGSIIHAIHLQKCKCCCIDSDCREKKEKTPPETPIKIAPITTEI